MRSITIMVGSQSLQMICRENSSDFAIIEDVWKRRIYSLDNIQRGKEIFDNYRSMIRNNIRPLIIDAGANIGASALWFNYFFPDSIIVAVEPEENNFDILTKNCEKHRNIQCQRAAISSVEAIFQVLDPGRDRCGYMTAPACNPKPVNFKSLSQTVRSVTVHDIIKEQKREASPFMIKVDIEGGESDLFAKNTSWVDAFPLIMIELHDWMLPGQAASKNLMCTIAPLGRDFVHVGETIFSIKN